MIETFRQKAEEYIDSAIILLSQLISFRSVMGAAEENAPFGKGCAEVLKFAEETLETEFAVRNFDNYVVTASFNDAPAQLGILAHLDVVPVEGQKWTTDPFTADLRDDRIYGRGAIDDKGPAAAVITAMRIIKDMGLPIKRNCRLILGSNEENGSGDLRYYLTRESFPPMLFTPDAEFPLITAEKGNVRFEFSGEYGADTILSLRGGSVVNAVPESASAVVALPADRVRAAAGERPGVKVRVDETEGGTLITVAGRGAHASTPEKGMNAITALLEILSALPIEGALSDEVRKLSAMYPYGENNGAGAGISLKDEVSGETTSVLSVASCEKGRFSFLTDTRFPVTFTSEDVIAPLTRRSGGTGRAVLVSEPHRANEDSDFVRTLLSVYEDCTGEKGRCLAIGGGTYVHDTPGGVAFGAEWSGENNMHGADEFIGIEELKKDILIYTETIYRLCCV